MQNNRPDTSADPDGAAEDETAARPALRPSGWVAALARDPGDELADTTTLAAPRTSRIGPDASPDDATEDLQRLEAAVQRLQEAWTAAEERTPAGTGEGPAGSMSSATEATDAADFDRLDAERRSAMASLDTALAGLFDDTRRIDSADSTGAVSETTHDELSRRAIRLDRLKSELESLGLRRPARDTGSAMASAGRPAERRVPARHREVTRLLVTAASSRPLKYPLYKAVMIVGRASDSDIQIRHHYVSRYHARLTSEADGCFIEDLGSKNGVRVNALRIRERRRLRNGDLVDIGKLRLEFVDLEAPFASRRDL